MPSSISLSVVLLHLVSVTRVSSQVPATAPACVQTCGRLKVSEGYCSSAPIFATAYSQCLRDNCNSADAGIGTQYASQICGAANTTAPATPTNGTAPATNGTGYGSTLNAALQAAGLTSLAALLANPASQGLVNALATGNHTVFAPTNDALGALSANASAGNNSADLEALLKYHILPGELNASALPSAGHAIVRSSLAGEPYVNLPANDSQVLVFAGNQNSPLTIIEPTRNITVANTTQVGNLQVSVIPTALTIPGTIGTTVAGIPELSSLNTAVNGASPQLFNQLDQTPGLTIFAPINSALSGAGNIANFQGVLVNLLVNGTVLYSTVLLNVTNATSAGGALLTFGSDSTVTSSGKTLKIVQSDILTKNGVMHLVDGIFDASNSTPTFPIPNTNNATETVGITPVGTGGSSTAGQGAKSAGTSLKFSPYILTSPFIMTILMFTFF